MRDYPEYIMRSLRQSMGMDERDTSADVFIKHMEPDRAFAEICRWNGLLGDWYERIKSWYEGIYEAEQMPERKKVFDPDEIPW